LEAGAFVRNSLATEDAKAGAFVKKLTTVNAQILRDVEAKVRNWLRL
jgi:hypothetical protein